MAQCRTMSFVFAALSQQGSPNRTSCGSSSSSLSMSASVGKVFIAANGNMVTSHLNTTRIINKHCNMNRKVNQCKIYRSFYVVHYSSSVQYPPIHTHTHMQTDSHTRTYTHSRTCATLVRCLTVGAVRPPCDDLGWYKTSTDLKYKKMITTFAFTPVTPVSVPQ